MMKIERYNLLPFQFKKTSHDKVLITNFVGEYIFVSYKDFQNIVNYKLGNNQKLCQDLKSKQIIADDNLDLPIDMLATKYRTKKQYLNEFTTLHMIVPTLRCNGECIYCQASSKKTKNHYYDMNKTTAKRIVEMILQSPANTLKIEFQGGEPLLNFDIVKFIINYTEKLNILYKKIIEFVLCTNLYLVDMRILNFLKKHKVFISTSFDGPEEIHNNNRPLQNGNSYKLFLEKLELAKEFLGMNYIAALMTTTHKSIKNFRNIVDEYIEQGFHSIFFRIINPYGQARKEIFNMNYSVDDFVEAFIDGLQYIIELNMDGIFFMEEYTTLLLTRILTPFSIGFVDLQSPAGVGIECAIYNYNGDVYLSDEGRMLGEMGNKEFCLGNATKDTYEKIFNNGLLRHIISETYLETLPECTDCVYLPYCGADPVKNYLEQKDIIGNKMISAHCKKNKLILEHLFSILENNNGDILDIFYSWINRIPLKIKMR